MEKILLEALPRHIKDKRVIGNSQHGFTKSKCCLTDLIALCDEVTGPAVWGQHVIYLSFSKTFEITYHSISMKAQVKYIPGRWTQRWVDHWADKQVVNGSKSIWQLLMPGWRAGQVFRKNILNRVRNVLMGTS